MVKKFTSIVNVIISGFFAFFLSFYFATGFISENYFSDDTFVRPEYFVIPIIWLIGIIFVVIHLFRDTWLFFILAIAVTWASIPVGIRIANYIIYNNFMINNF